ncbi:twin-arginine translocation signal domain-containing protein [Basfia succiniciproducens]|nr:twin-arginine translocation signal domain-containing protein [Basfia succiniciproducens]
MGNSNPDLNRRRFLKNTSAVSVGVAAASSLSLPFSSKADTTPYWHYVIF